ncbi:unnamed protein product [Amoebophrya sp. A120]|nr:unnamed protein product [Amoebophrya sp. A120]|eukprot:GSA120T00015610001.1
MSVVFNLIRVGLSLTTLSAFCFLFMTSLLRRNGSFRIALFGFYRAENIRNAPAAPATSSVCDRRNMHADGVLGVSKRNLLKHFPIDLVLIWGFLYYLHLIAAQATTDVQGSFIVKTRDTMAASLLAYQEHSLVFLPMLVLHAVLCGSSSAYYTRKRNLLALFWIVVKLYYPFAMYFGLHFVRPDFRLLFGYFVDYALMYDMARFGVFATCVHDEEKQGKGS